MIAKTLYVAEAVVILFSRRYADANGFTSIVRIESVVDNIDRIPGVLIISCDCIDGHAALHHTRSVEEGRSETSRTSYTNFVNFLILVL